MMTRRVVVAYGGSVQGAAAIAALRDRLAAEVVTVTLDFGQRLDFEQVRDQALSAGAVRAHLVDARTAVARDVIRTALVAGAFEREPLGLAITRPLIASHLVSVARIEGARELAHAGAGDDRVRLDQLVTDLAPDLTVHALEAGAAGDVRTSDHLWARTVTMPAACASPSVRLFTRTHLPESCPPDPAVVEVAVDRGLPVAINGIPLELAELIEVVDTIAGDHGIGRFDHLRDGERVVTESPAAVVLSKAISALSAAVLSAETAALRGTSSQVSWALLDQGRWHAPARAELDAVVRSIAGGLTGVARLVLLRGQVTVAAQQAGETIGTAFEAGAHLRPSGYGGQAAPCTMH